jgi:hypothetical protein
MGSKIRLNKRLGNLREGRVEWQQTRRKIGRGGYGAIAIYLGGFSRQDLLRQFGRSRSFGKDLLGRDRRER